jgi:spore photoproduct lyase
MDSWRYRSVTMKTDYAAKFESFRGRTLYETLERDSREFIRDIAFTHRFTFQEFRQVVEAERDLAMWGEGGVRDVWRSGDSEGRTDDPSRKRRLLRSLAEHLTSLKGRPSYKNDRSSPPEHRERGPVVTEASDKTVWGMCPVASDRTVCCNLRTIDAVENCVFGCSYCTVQTFYGKDVVFDKDFADKLKAIPVEPGRFYHFGTGQASDSLAFGNRNGVLDALCEFAADHPNILLELKTKSDNVAYFVDNDIPQNIVCSWSLNTPVVIDNEEHFTASLERRIQAARRVADEGVKVAFHFHPMVYYEGWEGDYSGVASMVLDAFKPDEVLFISFGSVTLIKPALRKIRALGNPTKMTQIDFVTDPHGKLTYRDAIKIEMFRVLNHAFEPWHGKVFMYLCMEKREIWEAVFGRVYGSNEAFEKAFGAEIMGKIAGSFSI